MLFNDLCRAVRKQLFIQSFKDFYVNFWPIIDPAEFEDNWHLDHICSQLQYASKTQGHRCMVSTPPRHGKSTTQNASFPAWVWSWWPEAKIVSVSCSRQLSSRDAGFSKSIIECDEYQELFGDVFQLTKGENNKLKYTNTKGGHRIATSIDGGIVGEGADIILIDDPYNSQQAYNKAEQRKVIHWWKHTIQSRLNRKGMNIILFNMQRFVNNDLPGTIIQSPEYKDWDHLIFPMEYSSSHMKTKSSIGLTDPRTKEGELLIADGYPEGYIEKLKVNRISWMGQYLQHPGTFADGLIDCQYIQRFHKLPDNLTAITLVIDASTGESSDYTAMAVTGRSAHKYVYLIEMRRFKLDIMGIYGEAKKLLDKYSKISKVKIEFQSNGQPLFQLLRADGVVGLVKITRKKGEDKLSRAISVIPDLPSLYIQSGVDGDLVINEIMEFNEADTHANDDMFDVIMDSIHHHRPRNKGMLAAMDLFRG